MFVALAEEAGLRRNQLTHKHTDLKDLFYAEMKVGGHNESVAIGVAGVSVVISGEYSRSIYDY